VLSKGSWVIITYHNVGNPTGWGWYPMAEFIKDMEKLAEGDYWFANTDDAAIYIMEKNRFTAKASLVSVSERSAGYSVEFSDGLDNATYDQPLTLELVVPLSSRFSSAIVTAPDGSSRLYDVDHGTFRINVVPDEKRWKIQLVSSPT
jgi:hypothetical protein